MEEKLNGVGFEPEQMQAAQSAMVQADGEKLMALSDYKKYYNHPVVWKCLARFNEGYEPWRDSSSGYKDENKYGTIATLYKVKKGKESYAPVLEKAGGGGLTSWVVKDDATAKAILKAPNALYGEIRVLPNENVKRRSIPEHKLVEAKRLAAINNSFAMPAIDMIEFDEKYRPAMEQVFGGYMICDKEEIAKTLALDSKDVGLLCWTKKGDKYDPRGTLEGGGKLRTDLIQDLLKSYDAAEGLYADVEERYDNAKKVYDQQREKQAEAQKWAGERDHVKRGIEMQEQLMKTTAGGALTLTIADMKKQIEDATKFEVEFKETKKTLEKEVAAAEEQFKNLNNTRKEREDAVDKQLEEAKGKIKPIQKKFDEAKEKFDALNTELEVIQEVQKGIDERDGDKKAELDAEQKSIDDAQGKIDADTKKLEEDEAKVAEAKEELAKNSAMIGELRVEKNELGKKEQADKKTLAKQDNKLQKAKEATDLQSVTLAVITKKHGWIESEKHNFGKKGSEYDFMKYGKTENASVANARREREDLDLEQKTLGKNVNKKVMTQCDVAEEQYDKVQYQKKNVDAERVQLERGIEELDKKKKEVITATIAEVSSSFGEIFGSLLSGVTSKLEPPINAVTQEVEKDAVVSGLEIKVAFNGVWKQSLTELSGGQRSLLSLSLVLALLRYKPAPMYILDEVDSALDVSHTQNIGRMIKKHFPNSQFIIVSLKDGMFNNANVLFKTKFVNGTSQVDRIIDNKVCNDPTIVSVNLTEEEKEKHLIRQKEMSGEGKAKKRKVGAN